MIKSEKAEKIIVALDVPTAQAAREVVAELKEFGCLFKIGLQLFTAAGAGFVRELVAAEAKIFLDLKFHDIPNTVAAASVEAARLGVFMFNIHALGGGEMMRRTANAVREVCARENRQNPKLIAVTVLTSANEETLAEVGINFAPENEVIKLAKLAEKCGLDGVVASPKEVKLIRKDIENKDFLIVTPGIRPSFATFDDQKRVMSPREACEAGTDFLVIGRPILVAENRSEALLKILGEID
jgi:orotidine-5'-phosphate decarboxylase